LQKDTNHIPPPLAIERADGFPVEELGRLVKIEGRGQEVSRPPLYLHKWWARRFGSVFRSILLGTLLDSEDDPWEAHYQAHDFAKTVILDPFMGSGTTLFEATRLGAKAIGCDINPVAWWTARTAILPLTTSWGQLEETFREIERKALDLFDPYYRTICPDYGTPTARARHIRWARVLPCEHCGEQTMLFKKHLLGKYQGGNWLHCPDCGFVFWTTQPSQSGIPCPECRTTFDPHKGNTRRGKFVCDSCGQETLIRKAMSHLSDPTGNAEMFAVLYDCPEHGWGLQRPSEIDRESYRLAQEALREMAPDLSIPSAPISSEGRSDPRPTNYGYSFWHEMFTPRQLLVLGWLAMQVRDLPLEVKAPLATLVSQLTNYTNTFCVSRPNRPAAISWIFRMHAFVPPTDFVESNPLAGRRVSGTFQSLFWRGIGRAHEYRQQPAERRVNPDKETQSVAVPIRGERIQPTLVSSWKELVETANSVMLLCQPSDHLPLPDNSVSHVVTDPPFYDNVTYGELSEFNYVWLRQMLGQDFPEFSEPTIHRESELIVSKRIGKDDDFYTRGLASIFSECHRVLTDAGALIFTFHHKTNKAWETLLHALLEAKFQVSIVHPVRSESDRSLHIMNGDTIEHDVVIVCRKQRKPRYTKWDDLVERMRIEAEDLIGRIDPHYRQSSANVSTLVFGQCLKLFSEHYPAIDGAHEVVSVAAAIHAAEQIAEAIVASQPS